ncbi:hypothetical protein AK830_g6698 [Neonectria ditissima]|uniref:N-acetyltransferase domain-containing protein n=1 Tax=Neonectria ditissima TaxID=78410 RepID=A0A0P7B1B4_9HYPO|nr:hypothetical protein AK830_g6698 [Neonectria ditissima]
MVSASDTRLESEVPVSSKQSVSIRQAATAADVSSAATCFRAYAEWFGRLGLDLTFQNFAAELEGLPGKYAPPTGALLLARDAQTDQVLGCVALRPLEVQPEYRTGRLDDVRYCEVKRLFVYPEARGRRVARLLIGEVMRIAEKEGYDEVLLDTLGRIKAAVTLYRSEGFAEVEPYYHNPLDGGRILLMLLPTGVQREKCERAKMPVITTEASLPFHLKGIMLSSLPRTFRDAVSIARRLGLRYLWIDSLCIIQDSVKDWEIESSKMADIYRQSFIAIAATSSPDFRGGCFSPEAKEDLCFQVHTGTIDTAIAMRDCDGDDPIMEMAQFEKGFPLFTRAWVYQERMLSRRILYCNHRELQFECRQETNCECGNRFMPPHAMPKTEASQGMLQGKDQYAEPEKFDGTKGKFSADQLTQHWQRTVTQYTKLGLTKSSDKLPALSGCAKDIGRLTGDRYLAGIWRASFAEGMLWTVRPPVNLHRPVPRAPSWSWVSVDTTAGIDYTYALKTRHRQAFQDKIREVDCVLDGRDHTGSVKSGFVRLQTSLCPAHLRRICRRCTTSRSRVAYTVEYDRTGLEDFQAELLPGFQVRRQERFRLLRRREFRGM